MSKKPISRRDFLRFTGTTLAGTVLAACTPQTQPAADPTQAPVEPSATAVAKAETTATTAPAAPTATAAPTELPMVDLKYNIIGGSQPDLPVVNDAINAYLKQKGLNINLTIELFDWGAYNEKMGLAHQAGEEMDLEFSAPWTNNYASNVAGELYLPLDDLLPQYAPGLWASMTPEMWNAPRIKGKIYGAINQQQFPKWWGIQVRKDLADKYGLDVSKLTGYDDPALDEFIQKVKDGGDVKYVADGPYFLTEMEGYDPINGVFVVINANDPEAKPESYYTTDAFKTACSRVKRWMDAGFIPVEPLQDVDASITAGDVGMRLTQPVGPGAEIGLKNKYGMDFYAKGMIDPILNTDGMVATLTSVSVTSKNPERAVMLIEAINTDVELYNLLCYGIEGQHWNWVDKDKKLIKLVENSAYNPNTNWQFGNVFNAYYIDEAQIGNYEKMAEINKTAKPSPALGFNFDRKPIEIELAQLGPVMDPINAVLFGGQFEDLDGEVQAAIEAAQGAGIDKVVEEAVAQFDAWKKSM